jgi:heme-degrading monooxygenase HmoA
LLPDSTGRKMARSASPLREIPRAPVIARIWHGTTPSAKADEYLAFLKARAIPDYAGVAGNLGVQILRRADGDITHFITLTHWVSKQAIETFAGADISQAKYYPEDTDFLLEFEPTVQHYEVFTAA